VTLYALRERGFESVTVPDTAKLSSIYDRETLDEEPGRLGRLVQAGVALLFFATLAVYALAAIRAAETVHGPFLGAFVEPTLVVNRVGEDTWTGRASGLGWPDRLISLDGQQLTGPDSLYQQLSKLEAGDSVTLEVEGGRRSRRDVTVTLQSWPGSVVAGFFGFPFAIGLGYFIAGAAVFMARRRTIAGRTFGAFCAALALTTGTLFDLYTTHAFVPAFIGGLALVGGSLVHLALRFPRRSRLVQRWRWLPALVYVPPACLALGALGVLSNHGQPWVYEVASRLLHFYAALGVLLWVGMLLRRRLLTESLAAREQVRIILLGVVIGGFPLVIWFALASLNVRLAFQPALLFAPVILLPVSVGYAMVRHGILDLDRVLIRGASYTVLALVVLGGYLLIVTGLDALPGMAFEPGNPLLIVLLVFVVTLAFNPLQGRLQRSIEHLLYGDRVDYRQALEAYSRDLGPLASKTEIFTALSGQVETAVHPARLLFFLYDESSAQFALPSDREGALRGVRFSPHGGLARRLVERRETLHLVPGQDLPPELEFEADQLAAVHATLYIPVPQHGWLALGEKRSGESYSADDLDYLAALGDQTSLALDRVQLISNLERKVAELNALRWISQAVHFSVELDDLLELIYAQTSRVLDTTNFYIALYDEAKGTLSFAFYVEKNERYYPTDEWPLEVAGLQSEIIRHGQPIVTDDYLNECLRRDLSPGGKAGRAWMGVPLNAGDRVIGVMNVSSSDPGVTYSLDQLAIFSAIADQAAAIIDKARLDAQMEERARQLSVLNEVGSTINSSLDLQRVLQVITGKATEILDAESGSLFLTDENSGDLVFQVAVGPSAESLVGMRLASGTGIVGRTAETQETIIVNDTQKETDWFAGTDESTGYITRAILSVPLVHKAQSIGVLQVLNKRDGSPFDEEDKQLMLAFASQAAAALENARLFTLTDQALAARVEELSMFQKIDRALNATLDYEEVMGLTLAWAMRMTRAKVGAILNLDEEKGGLFIVASEGYPEEYARYRDQPWPVSEGIVGRAVRTGEPVQVGDVTADPDYVSAVEETRSQLAVPMRLGERVTGVISLERPEVGGFGSGELEFLTRLAERAVVPIENAQLYEQVKRANEAKSQFVSMVAHELKIPMTSIKGYSRLLELNVEALDDTSKGFVKTINSNIDRMTKTVNDLLDISRIETGRIKLEMEAVPVPAVIEETLAALRGTIEDKGLALKIDVPPDLPLVWGDRTRLVQVLTNLLSNAAKYTPAGSIQISAHEVGASAKDNGHDSGALSCFVRCAVSDTGIGIAKQDQERLFKSQFVRFENAVEVASGHGLGLWLVNRLVQMQGGEITFESELDQGSTFAFTIPVLAGDEVMVPLSK
jgi:signal transduction histidine kinase